MRDERGNVIFLVLIAVILIGSLSAAIMNSGNSDSANIDDETLLIKMSQVRSQSGEFHRGVQYILQNGASQDDIRFAHGDAHTDYGTISSNSEQQLFHPDGGAARYPNVPSGISDGSAWEFYGHSAAPSVGSSRADLMAVLPNVNESLCRALNTANEQPFPLGDTGSCVHDTGERFSDSTQYASSPSTMNESNFTQDPTISAVKPAPQACVQCADGNYHYYYVLLER